MQKLNDGFNRMIEDRIRAIRKKMQEPPAPKPQQTGKLPQQDVVEMIKFRIEIVRMVQELEKFVQAGPQPKTKTTV